MNRYPVYEEIQLESHVFPGIARRRMTKFTGSLCAEVVRKYLAESGIHVSSRNVFVAGVPIEIDLIIPHPSSQPKYGLIYEPEDVVGILEIKFSGAYSQDVAPHLKEQFARIRSICPGARCAYLTVCENLRYKGRVTTDRLGFQAFTLYWVNGKGQVERLGDPWESVVRFFK